MARAVIVDLDGTLVPKGMWEPVFRDACAYIADRAGVDVDEVCTRVRALHNAMMARLDIKAFDWDYVYRLVAARLGVDVRIRIVDFLRPHLSRFRAFPGAGEFLSMLRRRARVIIGTNGYANYQRPVADFLGLLDLVDKFRTSDMVGCPKTCREFFEGAIISVGDNPLFDVQYPKSFGLRTIFVGNWAVEYERAKKIFGGLLNEAMPDIAVSGIWEISEEMIDRLLT